MASTRLASLINAAAEPGKFLAIAENLEDMDREALMLAFEYMERNRRTHEGMPTPGEIRALGNELLATKRKHDNDTRDANEMRELRRREANGERFFGLADLAKAFEPKLAEMPETDIEARRAELQRQKVELCSKSQ